MDYPDLDLMVVDFGNRFSSASMWRKTGLFAGAGMLLLAVAGPLLADFCTRMDQTYAAALMATFIAICCVPTGLPFLAVIRSCEFVSGHGEGLAIGCDGIGGIIGAALATALAMTVGFNSVALVLVIGFVCFAIFKPNDDASGHVGMD